MNIIKAEKGDLSEILDLQYLAYQSEARLFDSIGNSSEFPIEQKIALRAGSHCGGEELCR